jgi:histidinol-phosphatase
VLIREAGGTFSNLQGAAGPNGSSAIGTNGRLHDTVLALLNGE